ncbi:MAG: DUF938 domain-containing protein [Gomphosphaeria aponina SAG 52.96 = DSM 107014]|uniref:DUF938 domain-containing protein n=1 Tax=Gomphosphaeria aponina SAG 52.96 = DSM 107014 TaxID=1521640 RepID=A0A941GT41_9CHRO|nr:DUF938 domain-containing protein [Gomphosphaeria aponina SAG 52.96 = DSM 107014]
MNNDDERKYAPATERNREAILAVLLRILPPRGNILEIASGTGEHAVYFAPHLAPRMWIPSDPDPQLRASIAAWQRHFPANNLEPPLNIDAIESVWEVETREMGIKAIANINMIHISPFSACLGLMAGASRILPAGGILYLYGPFFQAGEKIAPSNLEFNQSLRSQNPEWGVRKLAAVVDVAKNKGLNLQEIIPMPANNLSVVFQKS